MFSFALKLAALWLLAIIGVLALCLLQLPDYINAPLLFIGAWAFLAGLYWLCRVEA